MGLVKVDLLVILGFPLFNEQKFVVVFFRKVVVVTNTAILTPYGIQNTGFLYFLNERLSFLRQAGELDIDGINDTSSFVYDKSIAQIKFKINIDKKSAL